MAPSTLAGKRVVITRSAPQSEELARELSGLGAIPVIIPLISFAEPGDFAPLDAAIAEVQRFDWMILTSAQAVRAVVKRSEALKRGLVHSEGTPRIACVGPVTAKAVRQAGLAVAYVAVTHNGAALAEELGERLRGAKVFLPRSDRANPDLPRALKQHGAEVTEVIAYRTLRRPDIEEEKLTEFLNGKANAILFFSPSSVLYFSEAFGGERLSETQDKLAIAAVGPVTAKALREAGVTRLVISGDTTAAAVIVALEEHFAGTMKQSTAGAKRV